MHHPDFDHQCREVLGRATPDWSATIDNAKKHIQAWVRKQPRPDKNLAELEGQMLEMQSTAPSMQNADKEHHLQMEYNTALQQVNSY